MCFHDVAVVCSCSYCFLLKHLKPTNPPLDLFGGFGCGWKRQENNNMIYIYIYVFYIYIHIICETIGRKNICASSTLDLYLGFIASNQGSANLLQAAIHQTSTEWEMILQSLDLRTNFAEGSSWILKDCNGNKNIQKSQWVLFRP